VVPAALLSGFLLIDCNPGAALDTWPLRASGGASALPKNLGHRVAEVFTVMRCQWREKAAEFGVHLSMESSSRPAAGIRRRHPQCAPVAWHRRPLNKAAALGPIDQACERGFLHGKTACQFGHSSRTVGQDAQKPCLDGSEVMVFGDARISALHQARELEEPGGRFVGLRIDRTGVLFGSFAAPGGSCMGGGRLCAVVHRSKVHVRES
jgi:hypothetical protein